MNFRWENDKNTFLGNPEDEKIFNSLSIEVQNEIYTRFVFKKFLGKFKAFFRFSKRYGDHKLNILSTLQLQ